MAEKKGYSDQLMQQYRKSGWFSMLSKGVMYRMGDRLSSYVAITSYNTQMNKTFQFQGMSDIPFDYTDFESIRKVLIENVNQNLTVTDREFLISFERGSPEWDKCCAGDLSSYPSIQWKLKNILTLKETNPSKFSEGIKKISQFLFSPDARL
jgi:hypothetical protein